MKPTVARGYPYTVFSAATGKYIRSGRVPNPGDVTGQARAGEVVRARKHASDSRIVDGKIVHEKPAPRPVKATAVKAEAQRRIYQVYPLHKQIKIDRRDGPERKAMHAFIDAITDRSNEIEQTPGGISQDFAKDKYWP